MTITPSKFAHQMNWPPEQLPWTDERTDAFEWKKELFSSETYGIQPAGKILAEPPRDEIASPEWRPKILIALRGSTEAVLNLRIIDPDRIDPDRSARFIHGHMFPSSVNVLTGPEIASMFGRGTMSHTDAKTEEDQKTESVVKEAVVRILNAYAEEDFEPGFVSPLEREFCDLIESHGYKVIIAMQGELQANRASTSVLGEMVRVFGRTRENSTAKARYEACVNALRHHPSLTVRDAAALALCDLKDPRATSVLREAAANETNALVRTSHLEIANWLESLPACQTLSEI